MEETIVSFGQFGGVVVVILVVVGVFFYKFLVGVGISSNQIGHGAERGIVSILTGRGVMVRVGSFPRDEERCSTYCISEFLPDSGTFVGGVTKSKKDFSRGGRIVAFGLGPSSGRGLGRERVIGAYHSFVGKRKVNRTLCGRIKIRVTRGATGIHFYLRCSKTRFFSDFVRFGLGGGNVAGMGNGGFVGTRGTMDDCTSRLLDARDILIKTVGSGGIGRGARIRGIIFNCCLNGDTSICVDTLTLPI